MISQEEHIREIQIRMLDTTLSIQGLVQAFNIVRFGDRLLLESQPYLYRQLWPWAYRMKNILKCDGLFTWCLQEPSMFPIAIEEKGRELALSSLTSNTKGNALRLMRRLTNPSQLWQHLKERYEADNNPRKVHLIEKFFSTKKTNSMSIDEYLTEMKEVADLLEDVGVPLP